VKIAYVMPVHKNPAQAARLVERLADRDAVVIVHVDALADDSVERELRAATRQLGTVELLERRRCRWGGFGIVDVALRAFRVLLDRTVAFEYVLYVTGQDYPLAPAAALDARLREADGRSLLGAMPLPVPFWPHGGADRVERWHLVSRVALHLPLPWQRRPPAGLVLHGGGAYWALSRAAVEHVDGLIHDRPELLRYFRHVLHPDELFFQTLLMSSELAPNVIPEHLHYVSWDADPGPKILRVDDLDALAASGKLFARKFDLEVDAEVLDLIDERLLQQRNGVTR
jgi:hypothetical protein